MLIIQRELDKTSIPDQTRQLHAFNIMYDYPILLCKPLHIVLRV